ncbi:MAG: AarF/UbiB family protein, partial [Patescibacteria group bacterium]
DVDKNSIAGIQTTRLGNRHKAEPVLETDLRNLGVLARAGQVVIRADLVNTVQVYRDYKDTVMQEVDYITEVENALRMSELITDENIVVPTTYKQLCTSELIVQDYLEGMTVSEALNRNEAGENMIQTIQNQLGSDLSEQLGSLGYYFMRASLVGPYVYGDPHPGNFVLMRDSKVGIIDYGVILPGTARPDHLYKLWSNERVVWDGEQIDYAQHVVDMFRFYNARLFEALDRVSKEMKEFNLMDEFKDMMARLIEPHREKLDTHQKHGKGSQAQIVVNSVNGDNRFAIEIDEKNARLARARAQLWNSIGGFNLTESISPVVHKKIQNFIESHPSMISPKEPSIGLEEATGMVYDWFNKVYERDPLLFGPLFAKMRESLHKDAKLTT